MAKRECISAFTLDCSRGKIPTVDEPLVKEALWGWRVFEALARHTDPPVPLPPRTELLALEENLLEEPFSRLKEKLRAWASKRGIDHLALPEVRRSEKGGLLLEATDFRPYPFVLGFEGERALFFSLRGHTVRHSLRISRRGLLFGREKGVPVAFLSRVDELYSPIVLPLFSLELPGGVLGEALRRGIRLDWGNELFRQGGVYVLADPKAWSIRVWDAERGLFESLDLTTEEAFAEALYDMVLKRGPFFTSGPKGPLKAALQEEDEDGLRSLRQFSDLLAQGFVQVLKASPEALPLLPRFLPDGRWLRAEVQDGEVRVWAGRRPIEAGKGKDPDEDPILGMRAYWDSLALDLSSGVVDLLEVAPEPLRLPGKVLLFTPLWAIALPFDEGFTGSGI